MYTYSMSMHTASAQRRNEMNDRHKQILADIEKTFADAEAALLAAQAEQAARWDALIEKLEAAAQRRKKRDDEWAAAYLAAAQKD